MADVIAVVSDLMFSSRITGTARSLGVHALSVPTAGALEGELASGEVRLVLVDMELPDGQAAASVAAAAKHPSNPTTVAFYPHVRDDLAESARQAGAAHVMPRSKFVQQLPDLVGAHGRQDQ